ncbi:MAG: hypothetical protein LBL57_09975 [Tannerella sp.]|nr:hypothetical protein [Tannerella sp.]
MILLLFILASLLALICFGAIRLLNEKWREIIYFFVIYVVMFFTIRIVLYCIIKQDADPEYWNFKTFCKDAQVMSLFYIFPMFFISYLLFPFKTIKRSKTALIILSIPTILTLVAVGIGTVVEILHAFSDM